MKQHISIEDLKTLTDEQSHALCDNWLPAKYDLVAAKVCKDAENDVYDDIEFAVGEVILGRGTAITLRRLRLIEENVAEEEGETLDDEEAFDLPVADDWDYFNKEDCLPLLNIGQLIGMIQQTKAGQGGFKIVIPPSSEVLFDQEYTLEDKMGELNSAENLCDLLWEQLKALL
ncbi:MAG: hypothetical protein N2376_15055 [Clostridia bacterium]|nr:hypothetical protein [Clostridia bacterium]